LHLLGRINLKCKFYDQVVQLGMQFNIDSFWLDSVAPIAVCAISVVIPNFPIESTSPLRWVGMGI
jgi:hypothetical protein